MKKSMAKGNTVLAGFVAATRRRRRVISVSGAQSVASAEVIHSLLMAPAYARNCVQVASVNRQVHGGELRIH
jgi:hypothetical protein